MTPRQRAVDICENMCWVLGYGTLEDEVVDCAMLVAEAAHKEAMLQGLDSSRIGYWDNVIDCLRGFKRDGNNSKQ